MANLTLVPIDRWGNVDPSRETIEKDVPAERLYFNEDDAMVTTVDGDIYWIETSSDDPNGTEGIRALFRLTARLEKN